MTHENRVSHEIERMPEDYMSYKLNKHGRFAVNWAWTNNDVAMILEEIKYCKSPIVHICSGQSSIGDIRVDIIINNKMTPKEAHKSHNYIGAANILGNMASLPIKSGIANTIICDPPYYIKPLDHGVFKDLTNELIRILKPTGKLIFIAPWIPSSKLLVLSKLIAISIGKRNLNPFYKLLSISLKENAQLEDYCQDVV